MSGQADIGTWWATREAQTSRTVFYATLRERAPFMAPLDAPMHRRVTKVQPADFTAWCVLGAYAVGHGVAMVVAVAHKILDDAINFVASTMGDIDRDSLDTISRLLRAKEAVALEDVAERYRPIAQGDGDPGWDLSGGF